MRPILMSIGDRPIVSYWFFYGLGLAVAVSLSMWLSRRRHLGFWQMWWLCLLTVCSAFICARLGHYYFEPTFSGFWDLQKGGEVSFTGIAGALAVIAIWSSWHHMPLGDVLDCAGPGVFVAESIQRIGCLFNGCCFGPRTESFLGMRFPKMLTPLGDIGGSPAFLDQLRQGLVSAGDVYCLPVVPMQIFTSGLCLLVAGLGMWLFLRDRMRGRILWASCCSYGILRFASQWFRPGYDLDGSDRGWNSGHTLSLVMFVIGAGMLYFSGKYRFVVAACGKSPVRRGKHGRT